MLEIMKSVLSEKKQQLVVSSYGISYSAVRRRRNRSYGITNIVVVLVICDYISFFTNIFLKKEDRLGKRYDLAQPITLLARVLGWLLM